MINDIMKQQVNIADKVILELLEIAGVNPYDETGNINRNIKEDLYEKGYMIIMSQDKIELCDLTGHPYRTYKLETTYSFDGKNAKATIGYKLI